MAEAPENVFTPISCYVEGEGGSGRKCSVASFPTGKKTDCCKPPTTTQRNNEKMGAFIYRRLPYPDVPFRLEDGRTIYQGLTHQYENREGKRPVWTNTGSLTLGKFPSLDDCFKVVDARPG